MSALGQKRTLALRDAMSALPPEAGQGWGPGGRAGALVLQTDPQIYLAS